MHMWVICFSLPSNFCLCEFDRESRYQSGYVCFPFFCFLHALYRKTTLGLKGATLKFQK